MRTDAFCIEVYPGVFQKSKLPVISTIVRFHKSGDMEELRRALLCLSAMMGCIVQPIIAVQDLSGPQLAKLREVVDQIPWAEGFEPVINLYKSQDGNGDLRSKMLNEELKNVTSRYVTFLDFDDLLLPYAYGWLVNRLLRTNKAVTFGRVYATDFDGSKNLFVQRKHVYRYGYSYHEFLHHNHAPVHSFMMDLEKLNLDDIIYFDDQKFMEDYLMTLQIFNLDDCDWDSLKEDFYIGDYIHHIDRSHTLAVSNELEREEILASEQYIICQNRINDMRNSIKYKISN
jgi:hypothetical protein